MTDFFTKNKQLIITGVIVAVIILVYMNRSVIIGKLKK